MAVLAPRFVDEYAQLFRYGIPPETKVPGDTPNVINLSG